MPNEIRKQVQDQLDELDALIETALGKTFLIYYGHIFYKSHFKNPLKIPISYSVEAGI